jgi:hypothetical protein
MHTTNQPNKWYGMIWRYPLCLQRLPNDVGLDLIISDIFRRETLPYRCPGNEMTRERLRVRPSLSDRGPFFSDPNAESTADTRISRSTRSGDHVRAGAGRRLDPRFDSQPRPRFDSQPRPRFDSQPRPFFFSFFSSHAHHRRTREPPILSHYIRRQKGSVLNGTQCCPSTQGGDLRSVAFRASQSGRPASPPSPPPCAQMQQATHRTRRLRKTV